ncbi:MAG: helix-turn-helix transcriptional regulator [Bacteroidales bacterium]|nr:helix-turn-helix transcriptional regulator [Bacteroidales bacterium]
MKELSKLSQYVKSMRRKHGLTQEDLSAKSGVGLRFIRDLEQGKKTLRMDKVNDVLRLFGAELGVADIERKNVDEV